MLNRRTFLHLGLSAALAGLIPANCGRRKVKVRMTGASAHIGHRLRSLQKQPPASTTSCNVAIVGAGVSGLSTAYFLQQMGVNDVLLFDLEAAAGGNARSGSNSVTAFPLGAHYVPTPNNDLPEYLAFLKEAGVITGFEEGLPRYNDEYLCFEPEERLYINGSWQEGLVPHYGVPEEERLQLKNFLRLMDDYRSRKGSDGKSVFAIPADASSNDPHWIKLDNLTMQQWLQQMGFTGNYLHEYVNYCCRDDYGTKHSDISAWMGIHYFASRKGKAVNADHSDVLTWPQGNNFLVQALLKPVRHQLKTSCLVTNVRQHGKAVHITYLDVKKAVTKLVVAQQCVLCVPQFIVARLLGDEHRLQTVNKYFSYSPWMVANFSLRSITERKGAPMSWDNVLHNSASLGYVQATHQLLRQHVAKKHFTYYLPLTENDPKTERKQAQQKTADQWAQIVLKDMRRVHPDIEEAVDEMEITLWGHAMAQPLPGMVHGAVRKDLARSINNCIHFAHTDLAGNSIFEEAFYQGLSAAKKCTTPKT